MHPARLSSENMETRPAERCERQEAKRGEMQKVRRMAMQPAAADAEGATPAGAASP